MHNYSTLKGLLQKISRKSSGVSETVFVVQDWRPSIPASCCAFLIPRAELHTCLVLRSTSSKSHTYTFRNGFWFILLYNGKSKDKILFAAEKD